MKTEHHSRLTAPEIGNLWTQYLNDTAAICFQKYAVAKIEDEDIRLLYQFAQELSERHVKRIKEFFIQENFPIPHGFTDQDVNINAPRLFDDALFLNYLYVMSLHGIDGYGAAVTTSIRSDLRSYYIKCNMEGMILYHRIMEAMLAKGLMVRPPYINPPELVTFVKQPDFLTGWIGERRPLTSVEINSITFNLIKMNLHSTLKVAYSQVAQSQKVRNHLLRGLDISNKHIEIFNSLLSEDHLNSPISWESRVTNSTTSPFSDKLIMFQIQMSTITAVAFYGLALSVCSRKDLGTHYLRLMGEVLEFGKDGADLMIQNGWMEEPPTADDRKELAKRS
ncbi:DUF3231 family protein [Ammoniphilus sp. YIM 78166]|uniref:DUF3231 family protein n=1 Tax=Ammoniphilus sp. YIM 78166 TaxID=1644106 RepID=UPI0010700CC0|nr:DUF3231 family protein [Ammoniphilus sp. YIM 78166]